MYWVLVSCINPRISLGQYSVNCSKTTALLDMLQSQYDSTTILVHNLIKYHKEGIIARNQTILSWCLIGIWHTSKHDNYQYIICYCYIWAINIVNNLHIISIQLQIVLKLYTYLIINPGITHLVNRLTQKQGFHLTKIPTSF